ncbi:MAG: hypothetical protein DYG94_08200 [Leptolyngbya sp. PLA3]|nr:MAG: hypothetical protein EDM82_09360 [Cyanobacteria bacterium CYA]MCE7968713.1 hypothetical protein [Leptolyngbya sp. PL-A3]
MFGIRAPQSVLAATTLLVVLPACQSSGTRASVDGYNAGLSALAGAAQTPKVPSREAAEQLLASDANALTDMIAASTKALDELFASDLGPLLDASQEPQVFDAPELVDPSLPEPVVLEPSTPAPDPSGAGLSVLTDDLTLEDPVPVAEPPLSDLARQIVDSLASGLGYSDRPLEDALALLGLEALVPGAADAPLTSDLFTPNEQTQFEAARSLLDAIRAGEENPDAAADAAEQIAQDLAEQMPLRLDRAVLCSRVEGFGQYTEFAGNTLLAGRSQRVILYVELSRFGHSEIPGTDGQPRYAVDLSQRVEIYHEPDGVLAMATPTLADRRVSRNKFHDYYVVTAIDLPETLTVGQYGVRVTMRDRSDDSTAEVVVPLTIVADASALQP